MKEATLVRGRAVARLLGVKLLTLEVRVALEPVELEDRPAPRSGRRYPALPVGGGLAGAVRTIDEGEDSLAQARRRRQRR